MLGDLPEEDRRRIVALTRRRSFGRREVIFHEGDPADTMHLIGSGHVGIRVTTPLGDVATLAVLAQGDIVGELALVDVEGVRSATATAIEPTETLALHRREFEELRERHPRVQLFLTATLARQLRRMNTQLLEALYLPAERRVARRVLEIVDVYRNASAPTDVVTVPLTQEDIAALAGTSRATVNRVLGELQQQGAVHVARGRIQVLDVATVARRGGPT
jgi:CRP/FNR family transcriptional regulator, cyclic AMP receptor protein